MWQVGVTRLALFGPYPLFVSQLRLDILNILSHTNPEDISASAILPFFDRNFLEQPHSPPKKVAQLRGNPC